MVVIRGNSGVGKSSVARTLRLRFDRSAALIEQDHFRRIVLREHDQPRALNVELIDVVTRFALDHGRHAIVEGILYSDHYGDMLTSLVRDHDGPARCYYLHATFEESFRRHANRPQSAEYTADDMRDWYRDRDPIPALDETVVPATSSLEQTVERIVTDLARVHRAVAEDIGGRRIVTGSAGCAPHGEV